MTCSSTAFHAPMSVSNWPVEYAEPRWYAAYTCVNQEKRVASQFSERHVEHFLPTFESVRRWKDRSVRLQRPLFPGYLFVRLALKDRLKVLMVPSVVRLVGFNGGPVALSETEIETMQTSLIPELGAMPHKYLTEGRKVRIVNGPLIGTEGILIRKKNAFRVVVSIDLIMRAASVEIDATDLERI